MHRSAARPAIGEVGARARSLGALDLAPDRGARDHDGQGLNIEEDG